MSRLTIKTGIADADGREEVLTELWIVPMQFRHVRLGFHGAETA